MKTISTRVVSAIIAVIIVISLIYFYDIQGLRWLVYLTPFLAVRELVRMLFKPGEASGLQIFFVVLTLIIFFITARAPDFSMVGFASLGVIFCAFCILNEKKFADLEALKFFMSKGILGFLYVGVLPGLAFQILNLKYGKIWFLSMLAVVFAGDTMAYCFGMLWGKHKVSPLISPKKSFEGAVGGLLGSLLAGGAIHFFLPQFSVWILMLVGVLTGFISQLGDFFESLLKRVANRKDSGTMMPGHGGILDRLDGVLFGAPIFLTFAFLIEKLF
jgi:phosphatidate cytidylyltransferase